MPNRPPHPCPDCGTLVDTTRCPSCTTGYSRAHHNADSKRIYASRRWQATRRSVLTAQPYCPCGALARDVDHVTPLRDTADPYDVTNLQALCVSCHSRKTAKEIRLGLR